ncbi:MAG: hypothetical protein Q9226_007048 [Calogaya cf. arnoldii]
MVLTSLSRVSEWAAKLAKYVHFSSKSHGVDGTRSRNDNENIESPLINLPAELRIKIWTYVLGDRLIFVNSTKIFGSPKTYVSSRGCHPVDSVERAIHRLRRTWGRVFRIVEPSAVNTFERYRSLKKRYRGYTKAIECYLSVAEANIPAPAIDLNILRANRQIYREAFHILWTTNEFVFQRSTTFRKFTGSLSVTQRKTLANVHISIRVDPREDKLYSWHEVLSNHFTIKLPALKQLQIYLTLKAHSYRGPEVDLKEFHIHPIVNALTSCLRSLSWLQKKPQTRLKVLLDRRSDKTRFMFPIRLFYPRSPYRGLIRADLKAVVITGPGQGYLPCDEETMDALEMFYEAYILDHPNIKKVKAEFKRKYNARPQVTSAAETRSES